MYEILKQRYERNFVRKDQLQRYVALGKITQQQYEQIVKEKQEVELIKELEKFEAIIRKAANEYEPSILARYLIDVATAFSRFYNECSVANCDDDKLKEARCTLVYATSIVIKKGLSILGIDCPEKM